jgi:hypothetical protein
MKKLVIPVLSLIGNVIFYGSWFNSYKSYDSHQERVKAFVENLPAGVSVNAISILLIILTILSFVFIAKLYIPKWLQLTLIFVQVFFLSLLTWQLL